MVCTETSEARLPLEQHIDERPSVHGFHAVMRVCIRPSVLTKPSACITIWKSRRTLSHALEQPTPPEARPVLWNRIVPQACRTPGYKIFNIARTHPTLSTRFTDIEDIIFQAELRTSRSPNYILPAKSCTAACDQDFIEARIFARLRSV